MKVYVGKQPDNSPYNVDKSAKAIVERLCEHIFQYNRNVTTDNWFSSIRLAESLRINGLTFVGIIKKTHPYLFKRISSEVKYV